MEQEGNLIDPKEATRKKEKSWTEKKIQAYTTWLNALKKQVEQGVITSEQESAIVARSMVARDLFAQRWKKRAETDPLTSLPNKGVFRREYDRLVKSQQPFGLLIVDIDNFKQINTDLGYLAADVLLIQLASTLSTNIRTFRENGEKNDLVARFGGEEFVVLLPGISSEEDLKKIAEARLREPIARNPLTVRINGSEKDISLTVSIGGGIFRQENDPISFFEKVNNGLNEAKTTGKNKSIIPTSQPSI